jgi:hypothetical protein
VSKILYGCVRDLRNDPFSKDAIERLSRRLEPDNITFQPPLLKHESGLTLAIFNPNDSIGIRDLSVRLGNLSGSPDHWWEPLSKRPDGAHGIFRADRNHIELVSDIVASRSIWYYFDKELFIASTSQRAIVFFLKSFKFNQAVIPWMLSNGNLGPGHSWDSRIKILKGDSSLVLDRESWIMTIKSQDVAFKPSEKSPKEHEAELRNILARRFEAIDLDYSKWMLALSGGVDSRSILCMLENPDRVKCITWGLKETQSEKTSDAVIAKKLAEFYGAEHRFFATDISIEPADTLLNRFLLYGEGRVDNISGYMDGFKIWETLFNEGIQGVLRGDEGFGDIPVFTDLDVERIIGIVPLRDYEGLTVLGSEGLPVQDFPDWLARRDGESIATRRDRLIQQYELPFVLAALNDLKFSYVELANPLLSGDIIRKARELPDGLRNDKSLFKKIVRSISPKMGYAEYIDVESRENILRNEKIVNAVIRELSTDNAKSVLPGEFLADVLRQIDTELVTTGNVRSSLKRAIKPFVPKAIRRSVKKAPVKPSLDYNVLAFRIYIISAMNRILTSDANALGAGRQAK